MTVRSAVDRMAELRPGAAFLIGPEIGREMNFADLRRRSNEIARQLSSLGLSKGDKIAFLLDNGLFTSSLLLGTMYGGFVPVPLNVRAGEAHLAYVLDHCDAKVVFVSAEYFPLLEAIQPQVGREFPVIRADEDHGPNWERAQSHAQCLPDVQPEDVALLMYTSGSTGQPKGAVLSQRNVIAAAMNSIAAHNLTHDDRSLCVLPLYHINAVTVTLTSSLLAGGSVVMPHKFVVRSFWNWIVDYRCTWSAIVPAIISQLLDWIDPRAEGMTEGLRQIRFMRSSSAPLAPAQHRAFDEKFGILLIEAMGSTEAAGNVFSNPLRPETNKIGTPGRPFGFEARIVHPDGSNASAGEPGEIALRGPSIMRGYYKNPEGTAAVLAPDGWLRTGDLAYVDDDGYFFIVGRAKELIIKAGMNIAPRQIDDALEAHPAVLEAAAVGVADHYLGEDIVAFAVLREHAQVTTVELLEFCERQLGSFKTPSRIHLVGELPKGPSGKVQRLRLPECFQELLESGRCPGMANSSAAGRSAVRAAPEFAAPSTPVEHLIAETWAKALKVEKVGIHDNFFGLGGHSLVAIETLLQLRKRLAVELSLNWFFANPTIAQQAVLVSEQLFRSGVDVGTACSDNADQVAKAASSTRAVLDDVLFRRQSVFIGNDHIPARNRSVPCPLSHAQERIWFLERLHPGLRAYHEGDAARLHGKLDSKLLEDALNVVVARHEALRTLIRIDSGRPVQIVCDSWRLRIAMVELPAWAASERTCDVQQLVTEELRRPFDMSVEPPIRATLLRIAPDDHVFIIAIDHIIVDGWSLGVLWRELGIAYR
ncbi:MAG TPA: AMP-binding protein, partial [Planctomycetaceae bacterium]